ncbi:hypothetical protein, partial [Moorena sp. SIO4A1]|uniref:hypothetical protein n=1 Tax=Moorena sp. SIO4A1 TaxID=2607835 RepID=UPI0025E2ADFF
GQFLKRMAHISSPLKIIILHLDSLHSSMARKSKLSLPKASSQTPYFFLTPCQGNCDGLFPRFSLQSLLQYIA